MESIFGIYGLLNSEPRGKFADGSYGGRAQLDIRVSWVVNGLSQTMVLSLWTGSEEPLDPLSAIDLETLARTDKWAKLGLAGGSSRTRLAGTNELGIVLHQALLEALETAPTELFGLSQNMPTVLYFPADRRVVAPNRHEAVTRPADWGYQPAVYFGSDGPDWGSSIDNVLVWLEWLATARETDKRDLRVTDLLDFVNRLIFQESPDKRIERPHREELRSYVRTRHGLHNLNALSHGERAMLHILARTLTHMTSNTIVLIDEIEIHLHTRWLSRMFEALKDLLRSYPAVTVIFTTHNLDLIDLYRFETKEEGLIKGGYLIEDDIL